MTDEREPDPNLESELRQGAGRDWSAEAAEDERMTEKLRDRRMELSELMRRFVTTGQRVRAESGSQAFAGPIVFAGTDYAVVGRDDDEVAVKLVGATWTLETGGTEGHHQAASPISFKAHLSELESSGEVVRILVEDGRSLRGPIRTVASDNLSIDCDGSVVLIPFPAVIGVSRPRPS